MDEYLFQPFFPAGVDDGLQVADMTMDPSIADQAKQVQGFVIPDSSPDCRQQDGILKERAIPDGYIDPLKLLIDDTTSPQVQMADFGVTHLAFRETDILAIGNESGIVIFLVKTADKGG